MRGCWWPCMESTPRKGKTFLNRARATSSISCSKVRLTTWDDLIAPCRQRGAAGAVHQQWGAEVLQQGEEEQEEESRDRICRVRAGGGLPQNWIKPASGLFKFKLFLVFGQRFYLYLEINSSRPEPRHWNTSCHWGCFRESRTGSMTLSLPIPTASMWWKTCQGDRIQPRNWFELNW